jgi:ubiquinone/menaquinone biosynthesis C-methylase UbiE
MIKNEAKFWDKTWSRPYGRYNRHHKEIWEAVVPFIKGKVIDLGVGTALMYQGKDIDLTGIDWSETGIEEAKKNYPQGKFSVGDIRKTDFPDKHFDTCILAGILDYFDDWEEVLKEARRITKGEIIATLLNGFQGHSWALVKYPIIKKVSNWIIIKI